MTSPCARVVSPTVDERRAQGPFELPRCGALDRSPLAAEAKVLMLTSTDVDAALEGSELIPVNEGDLSHARAVERQLLDLDIPACLGKPPTRACCRGGCGCDAKVQVLVRAGDAQRVASVLQAEWLDAVRREGRIEAAPLVPLETPGDGELTCPACSSVGALVAGACADCGLVPSPPPRCSPPRPTGLPAL
jgi:hypothetical protein